MPTLEGLYAAHQAKFQEIVEHLCNELKLDRAAAEDEADELIENWITAEAEDTPPTPSTPLQQLLADHHEIGEKIIDAEESK